MADDEVLQVDTLLRHHLLDDDPELINSGPYGDGWLFELEVTDDGQLDDLLDAAAYGTLAG